MHALVFLCINQHKEFEVLSFTNSKNMIEHNILKGSRDPEQAHYMSSLSSKAKHLIYSTCIQNYVTVA